MKFNNKCIGIAAELKQSSYLAQFLGMEITSSDAKDFFASMSSDL